MSAPPYPEETLVEVERIIGYRFYDRGLLFKALCHRSYANEIGLPHIDSNERLEFLGDSVVELAVTHVLFEDFPDCPEGELTKIRSPLVRGKALADVCARIGLDRHILLGKGEEITGGRRKQSILADSFEAVVGALYLDAGFDIAFTFVNASLDEVMAEIVKSGPGDYKSELQERSTKILGSVPRYRMRDDGPDHFKTFHATVEVGDKSFGPVSGPSKKDAEQGAARLALVKLGWRREGDEEYYKRRVCPDCGSGRDKDCLGGDRQGRRVPSPAGGRLPGRKLAKDDRDAPGHRGFWKRILQHRRP